MVLLFALSLHGVSESWLWFFSPGLGAISAKREWEEGIGFAVEETADEDITGWFAMRVCALHH
jgi:hypothetical protein